MIINFKKYQISKSKLVKTCLINNKVVIDIRKFYFVETKNTKKINFNKQGITLCVEEWTKLKDNLNNLKSIIKSQEPFDFKLFEQKDKKLRVSSFSKNTNKKQTINQNQNDDNSLSEQSLISNNYLISFRQFYSLNSTKNSAGKEDAKHLRVICLTLEEWDSFLKTIIFVDQDVNTLENLRNEMSADMIKIY